MAHTVGFGQLLGGDGVVLGRAQVDRDLGLEFSRHCDGGDGEGAGRASE